MLIPVSLCDFGIGTKYWSLRLWIFMSCCYLKGLFFLSEFLNKQFQNVTPSVNVFWKQYKPSFLSSGVIFTFVSVISLKDARKSTTSPFSFFMGTISNRHQNGDPATIIKNTDQPLPCMVFLRKSQKISATVNKVLTVFFCPTTSPLNILKMSVFRFHKCLAHVHSLKIRQYFNKNTCLCWGISAYVIQIVFLLWTCWWWRIPLHEALPLPTPITL